MCQWDKYFTKIADWNLLYIRQESAYDWYI